MKRILLVYLLTIAIINVSCEKWLETSPVSSIVPSVLWKAEDDATGVLNGMYLEARSFCSFNLSIWGDMRSDMYQNATAGALWSQYYLQTLNSSSPGPNWYNIYRTINYANLLLTHIPDITFKSQAEKDRIIAQAYTMRAWCYFIITRTWGDAIIVTEPTEKYEPSKVYRPRSPKTEVFTLIKNDLDEALKLFPDYTFPSGRFRWTKTGANVLKADVYLWTGKTMGGGNADFQTALNALNEIQPATNLLLLKDYVSIFDFANKGNNEVIMVAHFNRPPEVSDNFYGYMYLNAMPSVSDADKVIIDAIGTGNAGNSIMEISNSVKAQFTMDDQRRNSFYQLYLTSGNYHSTITMKARGFNDNGLRRFASDIVIYRYADVLLLKAEAKNALGQDPSVEINEIRARAYGNKAADYLFVNGTKEENDAAILKERLLEFIFECKRWWDLVRFDKVYDFCPPYIGKTKDTNKYLFPIGTSVISNEPLVEENPGY